MIHTIFVQTDTTVAALKKEARKRLMTGGVVVRLEETLSADDCEKIYAEFGPGAESFGLAAQVLLELWRHPSASDSLRASLSELPIEEIRRATA